MRSPLLRFVASEGPRPAASAASAGRLTAVSWILALAGLFASCRAEEGTPWSAAAADGSDEEASIAECVAAPPAFDSSWDGRYDFSLATSGPERATRGYDLYFTVDTALVSGTRDYIFITTSGLPPGARVSYPDYDEFCCGGNRGWQAEPTLARVETSEQTPPGKYPIRISATSGGVTRETCRTLTVQPVPDPPIPRGADGAPMPGDLEAMWRRNMLREGAVLCDPGRIESFGLSEENVWYYDGIRVYYQMADYTGERFWESCAELVLDLYRSYVLAGKGVVPGWRVFPHGLKEDFLRRGDPLSRDAVLLLSQNSAFASSGGGVHPQLSRETAYAIHAYRIARSLGAEEHPRYRRAVDFALGHIDQWFISRTEPYMQPFMVGLTAEALIQYFEETRDPRVPPAIEAALDALWDTAWIADDKAFFYESVGQSSRGEPDLNLLIAPAFAWYWKTSGEPVYRERGDRIFEGGISAAWLQGGKQFSQNYRWSFDYVEWRKGDASKRSSSLRPFDLSTRLRHRLKRITPRKASEQLSGNPNRGSENLPPGAANTDLDP